MYFTKVKIIFERKNLNANIRWSFYTTNTDNCKCHKDFNYFTI